MTARSAVTRVCEWTERNWVLATSVALTLAVSVVVLACAANGRPLAAAQEEDVVSWAMCNDRVYGCPRWAPFARLSDAPWGPVYWVISATGRGCEVSPAVYALAKRGDRLPCAWRSAR